MKKVLVFLVALGFLLSGGAGALVNASPSDYLDLPDYNVPVR